MHKVICHSRARSAFVIRILIIHESIISPEKLPNLSFAIIKLQVYILYIYSTERKFVKKLNWRVYYAFMRVRKKLESYSRVNYARHK